MQRIDENTYIDDTLVTCAEYQLFIDEMREQGKYYQPDHWTSYQFPKGQAREPILGVRHTDATAFCRWLTQQNAEGWAFRLSTQEEADKFPVQAPSNEPLGYWLNEAYQFTWIRAVPKDMKNMIARARDGEIARAREVELAIDLARSLARVRALDRARARANPREVDLTNPRALVRDLDLDRNLARTLDIARDIARAREIDLTSPRARDIARALARARDIASALDRDLASPLDRDLADKYERTLYIVLDIYIDLFTIGERLAGRSPAYEGIRLVKERIR